MIRNYEDERVMMNNKNKKSAVISLGLVKVIKCYSHTINQ